VASTLLGYTAVYTHPLFCALVAFLKKWAYIKRPKSKIIFPSEIRDCRNRMQPFKGRKIENERAPMKKWCEWARGVGVK
jgi:hypothetical protein